MKVFLSWSGDRSKAMAEFLQNWLPDVIQAIDPWISSQNISQGSRPLPSIADELASCNFGIVCVTPENRSAEWINFEAGALSKALDDSVVIPLLLGIEKAQVTGPLSQFQMTLSTKKDEMFKLISDMNGRLGEMALAPDRLDRSFEQNWPKLEEELNSISQREDSRKPRLEKGRSAEDLMEEVLLLARRQERRLADVESSLEFLSARRDGSVRNARRLLSVQSPDGGARESRKRQAHRVMDLLSEYGVNSVRFEGDTAFVDLQAIPESGNGHEEFTAALDRVSSEINLTVTAQCGERKYTHNWPF
ncbi:MULTISPECIES: TIR domain-containing protein [unclassified Streptomyces]|uniref:TIR domain-containing protein n=1 Tax=unclassified Streptomyces TaxID=2593676 RepID=UPI0009A078DB|nr:MULTISPECIES: TIR domain-containing protein [unclassified Streptomyces]